MEPFIIWIQNFIILVMLYISIEHPPSSSYTCYIARGVPFLACKHIWYIMCACFKVSLFFQNHKLRCCLINFVSLSGQIISTNSLYGGQYWKTAWSAFLAWPLRTFRVLANNPFLLKLMPRCFFSYFNVIISIRELMICITSTTKH